MFSIFKIAKFAYMFLEYVSLDQRIWKGLAHLLLILSQGEQSKD